MLPKGIVTCTWCRKHNLSGEGKFLHPLIHVHTHSPRYFSRSHIIMRENFHGMSLGTWRLKTPTRNSHVLRFFRWIRKTQVASRSVEALQGCLQALTYNSVLLWLTSFQKPQLQSISIEFLLLVPSVLAVFSTFFKAHLKAHLSAVYSSRFFDMIPPRGYQAL